MGSEELKRLEKGYTIYYVEIMLKLDLPPKSPDNTPMSEGSKRIYLMSSCVAMRLNVIK